MVRTGTEKEGSCFFHAILTDLAPSYRKFTNSGKQEYIKKLRKKLSEDVTMDEWISLGKGQVALVPFQTTFQTYLQALYFAIFELTAQPSEACSIKISKLSEVNEILNNTVLKDCIEIYELILEILPWDKIEKDSVGKAFNACSRGQEKINDFSLDTCKEMIKNSFVVDICVAIESQVLKNHDSKNDPLLSSDYWSYECC